jgi:pimeloyl-ACP methyl ester carboxylesterase
LKVISYSDIGSGPTIIFLHGLSLNRNFWSTTITHLSPTHRCIAIDLPGHGESFEITTNGSMTSYVAAVREVIEKLNLTDVTLVGHSMGGQIAMILSLQMPSVISNLILVCAAGIETFTADEAEKLKSITNQVYSNPIADDVLARTFYNANPEIRALLMHEHVVHQKDNFRHLSYLVTSSVAGMLNEPVFPFLKEITQPVLMINGAMDAAIPNRWLHPALSLLELQAIAKREIPDCQTTIFPMAGHYLPVDAPKELAQKINSFA